MRLRVLLFNLGLKLRNLWSSWFSRRRSIRRGPGDGPEGAGVTAKLKPRPPVLVAQFAEPLPDADDVAA